MVKEQSCTMSFFLWAVFRGLSPLNHVKLVISNNFFFFSMKSLPHLLFHSTGEATLASSLSMGTYRIEVNFQPYFSLTRLVDFCSHPPALTAPSSKFISQAPCLSHLCFQPVISTWLWNLSWRDSYHFPSKVSIVALTLRPFNFLYCFLSRCLENWHPWFRES